jgi:hypothetical protein
VRHADDGQRVDPDDYMRPMTYDPDDRRWFIPERHRRAAQFCHR